jgi:hypothetical protein
MIYLNFITVPSAKADITFPRAERDLLIFLASSSTDPSAPVLLTLNTLISQQKKKEAKCTFSLPAKSTKYNLPDSFFWVALFSCSTCIWKTLCERELCSFMSEKRRKMDDKNNELTGYCHLPIGLPIFNGAQN